MNGMQQYATIHLFACDFITCDFINGCNSAAMRPTCYVVALHHASSLCLHECIVYWPFWMAYNAIVRQDHSIAKVFASQRCVQYQRQPTVLRMPCFLMLAPHSMVHRQQVARNTRNSCELVIRLIGCLNAVGDLTPCKSNPGQRICRRFHMRERNDMANGALLFCVMLRCAVLCRMVCGVLFSNYVVLCYLLGSELWLSMFVIHNLTDSVLETPSVIPSICLVM